MIHVCKLLHARNKEKKNKSKKQQNKEVKLEGTPNTFEKLHTINEKTFFLKFSRVVFLKLFSVIGYLAADECVVMI